MNLHIKSPEMTERSAAPQPIYHANGKFCVWLYTAVVISELKLAKAKGMVKESELNS